MRVLLLTPYYPPSVRGNAVTVARLAEGLRYSGVAVEVVSFENSGPQHAQAVASTFAPDLLHAFHGFASAPAVAAILRNRPVPYVLTATGTDMNHDLFDPEKQRTVLSMIRGASSVIAFHVSMREQIERVDPALAARVVIIRQSVALRESRRDFRKELRIADDEMVFTLPAGLRPVKRADFAMAPLTRLRSCGLQVRFLLAGPVIESDYAERIVESMGSHDWAHYLGVVAHEEMSGLYESSDVVMNTSESEGGMCNAVLEGLTHGRPILASDIPGNRSVVQDGVNGFLFENESEFEEKARRLIGDPDLRRRMGEAARASMKGFSFEEEIREHIRVYEEALLSRVSGL